MKRSRKGTVIRIKRGTGETEPGDITGKQNRETEPVEGIGRGNKKRDQGEGPGRGDERGRRKERHP